MAKFGLFNPGSSERPKQEFEGDYLEFAAQGACVAVAVVRNDGTNSRSFSVINLAAGQYIKELK